MILKCTTDFEDFIVDFNVEIPPGIEHGVNDGEEGDVTCTENDHDWREIPDRLITGKEGRSSSPNCHEDCLTQN